MYEHLEPLKTKLLKLQVESVRDPWQIKNSITVGGLIAVGFDRHSDNLLIVSHQGRELLTLERVLSSFLLVLFSAIA